MTDLQDEICDRLVAAKLGPNWVGGPIHVAALVIDPSFVPATRGDTRPRQFARAVGWPVVFCEAVIGANAVLPSESDRRSLAISLFGQVPPVNPGKNVKPMKWEVSRPALIWAVLRGHESACSATCPLQLACLEGLAGVHAGHKWTTPFKQGHDCQSAAKLHVERVTASSTAAHHAVVAMRYLSAVMHNRHDKHSLGDGMRESAKAETKVHGLDNAVSFCLTLASKLGMR